MNNVGIKKAVAGILLGVMMLGNSMPVHAYDCLENGHSFSTTKTFHHREVISIHTHTDKDTGLVYTCRSYKYYFVVTQKCSKCQAQFTIPEMYEMILEHVTE